MDIDNAGGYTLRNLSKINILLGKNGCGKSILLKAVEKATQASSEYATTKYITPERGGQLLYEAGVEQSMASSADWMPETRRVNQFTQFRQQSVAQYRQLEILVLRELERTPALRMNTAYTFDSYVGEINSLLDNIEIRRHEATFQIFKKGTEKSITAANISSGEAELISLGIECLVFEKESVKDRHNILFLDSPDVHLHPDLQARLMKFLRKLVDRTPFRVILATHSTAVTGSFSEYEHQAVAFMAVGQTEINFQSVTSIYQKLIPIFGAHPLSNLFNRCPILLVDGEDDERVWQQAVRSSQGRISLYPCAVDGETQFVEYETEIRNIMNSVYDDAKAYSLRDRDAGQEGIDDMPPITRMRLSCRAAENLLLSDDVLQSLGTDWESVRDGIANWIVNNPTHPHADTMTEFSHDYDRKGFNIKDIRNDLMGIIGSEKPWEVAIGQVISALQPPENNAIRENSIRDYLGTKVLDTLVS